jgi:CDP-glucose 4,6-dehydratase
MESLEMNPQFWRDRRVFLTGHTGFKGGWLALWLQSVGAKVAGYSLDPPSRPSLFALANVDDGMESVHGDILDLEHLCRAMDESHPEIVFHLAAQSLVRHGYAAPIETYATNVLGTAHLLESVRRVPSVRAVVIVITDKCYENREDGRPFCESDRLGGVDPYSSSKAAAELVTAAYRQSFFSNIKGREATGVASVRAGNVIGGGDWAADRLIPDIMRAACEGREVPIRNPHAIRPWQHVLEPLSGYLTLAEKLYCQPATFSEGWNFGPDDSDALPVSAIVERMGELWGPAMTWKVDGGPHPHEAHFLRLDCAKAKTRLGWQPRWNINRALEATVQWYKAQQTQANMRCETLAQIRSYQNQ